MKKKIILILVYIFLNSSPLFADVVNCDQFKKLSAKYIECNGKKIKEDTATKLEKGKKKFNNSTLKKKLVKFKNSKNLIEFLEKE